jgi:hypothetical protein
MATRETSGPEHSTAQLLPGFEPVTSLWEGNEALFPSENAARWLIRQRRQALIDAGAMAHLGRTFVHRERFLEVVRQYAVDSYKQRHSAAGQ